MHPPGKVLTSEREEAVGNNERMEAEREQHGMLRQEVFWLFLSPWNGILRLNRGDQAG